MNSSKLLGIMKEYGDTQASLAKVLGISRITLRRKVYELDDSCFNRVEIMIIKKRYNMSDETVKEIFFADLVS